MLDAFAGIRAGSLRPIKLVERAHAEEAMISRTSSATKKKIIDHVFGLTREPFAQLRILRGTPTGQVLRWHLRIMMQPSTTSGAVAKPNSSAPSTR